MGESSPCQLQDFHQQYHTLLGGGGHLADPLLNLTCTLKRCHFQKVPGRRCLNFRRILRLSNDSGKGDSMRKIMSFTISGMSFHEVSSQKKRHQKESKGLKLLEMTLPSFGGRFFMVQLAGCQFSATHRTTTICL